MDATSTCDNSITTRTRQPRSELADAINVLWYFEGPSFDDEVERVLPDGRFQLIINLDQDALVWCTGDDLDEEHREAGAAVGGGFTAAIGVPRRMQRRALGVSFQVGGLFPFTEAPVSAFSGRYAPLDVVFGETSGSEELRQALLGQESPAAMFDKLESFLLGVRRRRLVASIRQAITSLMSGELVSTAQRDTGLSSQLFRRRITEATGLLPKQLSQIVRLSKVVARTAELRSAQEHVDWADLAAEMGFADQAHLLRSFRRFTGITPSRYAPRSPGEANHVALDS